MHRIPDAPYSWCTVFLMHRIPDAPYSWCTVFLMHRIPDAPYFCCTVFLLAVILLAVFLTPMILMTIVFLSAVFPRHYDSAVRIFDTPCCFWSYYPHSVFLLAVFPTHCDIVVLLPHRVVSGRISDTPQIVLQFIIQSKSENWLPRGEVGAKYCPAAPWGSSDGWPPLLFH